MISDLIDKNLEISKPKKEIPQKPDTPPQTSVADDQRDRTDTDLSPVDTDTRREYEIQKIKFDAKLKELNYEKEIGTIVMRDSILHIWNKIYKSASYFGDFGQRYAGEFAAALGVSDPERILVLQKEIDRATELFIADFAETVAGEI